MARFDASTRDFRPVDILVRGDGWAVSAGESVGFVTGRDRDVLLCRWFEEGSPSAVEVLQAELLEIIGEYGYADCCFILPDKAPLASPGLRQASAEMFDELGSRIRRVAIVIEGGGFWAAAMRGVITGVALLSRRPTEHSVFPTVLDGLSWLMERRHPLPTTLESLTSLAAELAKREVAARAA